MNTYAFVVPNCRINGIFSFSFLPSLALLYLIAVLKGHGYAAHYIDADRDNLMDGDVCIILKDKKIDVVGITCNSFQADAALSLAAHLRKEMPGLRIIMGGPYPSALKGAMLEDHQCIDFLVASEGEETILEVAQAFESGSDLASIKGLCWRESDRVVENIPRPYIQDLDSLPLPAYDQAGDLHRYPGVAPVERPPSLHMMASRGCPFECVFCTKSVWGRKVRQRNHVRIADEIEFLHRHMKINEIFFHDDTMNLSRLWFSSLCDEIIRRDLNRSMAFKAAFRVNERLIDRELLVKAKNAGFYMIFFGVESGSQKVLDAIKKGITVDEIRRAFRLCHDVGLKTYASFMIGNFEETAETVEESIALCREIDPTAIGFSVATAFPGTAFNEEAFRRGWLEHKNFTGASYKPLLRNEALTGDDIIGLASHATMLFQDKFLK
jgi:anaerobic magnesium-protoporphyrin IX monomethyl ester cyclase